MAMLISRASGNFTSSSTWGVADSATGSQLTNPSASTNTTTSYVYSSTFTGTNTRVADGIALFLKRLNTTGTVTVALSDDNGVTATRSVTVNASDLPADESWVFFKFGTTLTLDGGTDYRIGVIASDAANAAIYRDATAGNWGRMVSTTLTAAPAATDTMLIVGEWTGAGASSPYTVTMDNTNTTDFGSNAANTALPTQTNPQTFNGIQIGQNGTLTWASSSATNYYLKLSGNLLVWSGGTYNMGTSGTPCPRDSTMTVEVDSPGAGNTTNYAFCANNGSNISIYGQSRTAGKNIVQCKLSADASVNATSLTVDTDTGWLDNDEIVIAPTSRTATESEFGTLNGNAGASTLTVDGFAGVAGGLAFAHSGTSPTQGEIVNTSRSVVIRNSTTNPNSNCYTLLVRNVASFNAHWCRFLAYSYWAGSPNATVTSTTPVNFYYCAFVHTTSTNVAGQLNYASLSGTVSDCTFTGNMSGPFINITTHPCTFQNCTAIGRSTGYITLRALPTSSISNIVMTGGGSGVEIGTPATGSVVYNNITSHSNNGTGFTFSALTAASTEILVTLNNLTSWRNVNNGVSANAPANLVFNNLVCFGNSAISLSASSFTGAALATLNNCTFAGDTTFSTLSGFAFPSLMFNGLYTFNNCNFSPSSGIYTAHTTGDIVLTSATVRSFITLNNTLLGAAAEVVNPQNLSTPGFIKSSKHDQTEGAFKSWFSGGVIERDTTIFNTAAPSERLTPTSATIKLASGPRLVAVDDGGTITINAYVRKSATGDGAAYNGNQPRLIVRANLACGITTDTVLDAMTVGTGTWEQLTGTTAAVDADGALEFYVDCDGTTGWINVDDWTVT